MTSEQRSDVYEITRDQSENDVWRFQRHGLITASVFYRVFTQTKTLMEDPIESPDALLKTLIERPTFENYATKHGINMEVHAIEAVMKILEKKTPHKTSGNHAWTSRV